MSKPLTRKEIFEEAIAKAEVPKIKPLTRQEIIMVKEAKREASGGGGTGGGVTYTDYFADGSYLYHDENYQTKVTKEEIATALETSIVRIGGPYAYTYFPFRVEVSSEGRVDIITLNNGEVEYATYYTAEHSDGPQ